MGGAVLNILILLCLLLTGLIGYIGFKFNTLVIPDYKVTQGRAIRALINDGKAKVWECNELSVKPLASK